MRLDSYILNLTDNYDKKEYLKIILDNIFGEEIDLFEFKIYFELSDYNDIVNFIMNKDNFYELQEYGYNCYEINHRKNDKVMWDYDIDNLSNEKPIRF